MAGVRGTQRAGGPDVFFLCDRDGAPTGDAGELRDEDDPQRQHNVGERLAEHRDEGQSQQDGGEREDGVHQAHQAVIGPATHVACHEPDGDADTHRHERCGDGDLGGDSGTEQHPREDVTPVAVRPHQVVGARRLQSVRHVDDGRVVGCEDRGEHGHEHERAHDDQATGCEPVPADPGGERLRPANGGRFPSRALALCGRPADHCLAAVGGSAVVGGHGGRCLGGWVGARCAVGHPSPRSLGLR